MEYGSMQVPSVTIGLDLGDKQHHLFALSHDGEIVANEPVENSKAALREVFTRFPPARVAIEVGGQSQWISEFLSDLGHEVIVASANALGSKKQRRKNDRKDAELLARKGRSDPAELRPIRHRGRDAQYDLCVIRSRDALVAARTKIMNLVRSMAKASGKRLPSCSTPTFTRHARAGIVEELRETVEPLLVTIDELTEKITGYDKTIKELAEKKYPETARLTQIAGVSHLTALAFVLTLEDPTLFRKSRSVGAFLGLVPALDDSGGREPQLKISKAGDSYMRRLLVSAAHYILGPFASASDLRRYGERIAERGAKNGKKRAVVAVARKLSVLLHHLWVSGDRYDPDYVLKTRSAA